jgi:ABC-type branched-subunit amino acid transport system substrate-binding protein
MSTRLGRHHVSAERSRSMRVVASIAVGLLSASTAACGARWTDEQAAELRARTTGSQSTGGSADASDQAVAGDDPAVAGLEPGADGTGAPQAGGPVSGPQAGGQAGGALPCEAPSDEVGVTDTEIVVGEISSLSGPVPGLGESSAAAVRAYVGFRNATGGVCGRKLVLREGDDGTDIARYRSVLEEMGSRVLGIAGGFAVGDIGSEGLISSLGIPIVNAPTGRTGTLPTVFDINPDFPRPDVLVGKYKHLFDLGARTVSMTYIAVDQSRIEANIQRGLMEAAGLRVVHVNELPLSTLSYDSPARAAANSGANYLWVTSDTNGQASMARAVDNTGHDWLIKEFSYTSYGTTFLQQAGAAAEGVTSWLRSLPTEEASSNKAMGTYVEWMNRVAPGSPMDLFSIDSYVAARAFIESLEALPGPISREALVAQLGTLDNFDADGMFAPINLGKDLSKGCFMGMIVRNGKWERFAPAGQGYLC